MPKTLGKVVVSILLAVTLAACEPATDLDVPARPDGAHALDPAELLPPEVEDRAAAFSAATGFDTVALAYTSEDAGRGEATRAARALLDAWDADLVLVAVARPGDFTSTETARGPRQRRRFFGIEPADAFAVPGALREAAVEEVRRAAEDNRWTEVFLGAMARLEEGLADEAPPGGTEETGGL